MKFSRQGLSLGLREEKQNFSLALCREESRTDPTGSPASFKGV